MQSHPFFFIAVVILPYVLLALVFLRVIRLAYISKSATKPLFFYPLVAAFFVTAAFVAWGQHDIFASRSSTAAIGLIFLPFYSIGIALIGFLVSGAFVYILRFILERGGVTPRLTSPAPLIASVLILFLTAWTIQTRISRHRLLAAAKTDISIEAVIHQAIAAHDLEALAAIARNQHTSTTDLLRIYQACKDRVGVANSRDGCFRAP